MDEVIEKEAGIIGPLVVDEAVKDLHFDRVELIETACLVP